MKLYGDQEFKVIGINTDSDLDAYKKRAKEHEVTWRNVWSGPSNGGVRSAFGISSFPTVILVDRRGVARWQGAFFSDDPKFKALLQELLAETE